MYLLQFGEQRRLQGVTQMPTRVFVDKLTSSTVDVEGSQSVLVRTTGLGKVENNFDLSVLANGRKFTLFVVQRETDSSIRRMC